MPDFKVTNHGSVWTIVAVSDAAKAFADENFQVEGWMGTPHRFTTDHRPAQSLCEQLIADGFDVALNQ